MVKCGEPPGSSLPSNTGADAVSFGNKVAICKPAHSRDGDSINELHQSISG